MEQPKECCFCRRPKSEVELAISHRMGFDGKVYSGALCKGCIRAFILDMADLEPDEFEKLVEEARNSPQE